MSTHRLSENFWSMWHKMYLSALRETHKLHMDSKRAGNSYPKEGMVVLLADPDIPRNIWKMGMISALNRSADGNIREVEVRMPNGNIVRRPVNLLAPLELQDEGKPVGKLINKEDDGLSTSPQQNAQRQLYCDHGFYTCPQRCRPAVRRSVGTSQDDAINRTTKQQKEAFCTHLSLWKDICKSGSELFNKAQEHFEIIAKNDNAAIEDISRRLHLLQQTVQQQHQHALLTPLPTPQQKFLEAIQASLKSTNKCISTRADDLKRTTMNRMDELEREIHNLRSDIQQTETLQRKVEAVNQRVTMLREEVTGKLNEILENQRILPQIWSALQTRFKQQSTKAGDAVEATEELHLIDSITDQSDNSMHYQSPRQDDFKVEKHPEKSLVRDQLRKISLELKRVNHEIFSLSHRIEQERRRTEGRKDQQTRLEEMRKSKRALLGEEIRLKEKERKLQMELEEMAKVQSDEPNRVTQTKGHRNAITASIDPASQSAVADTLFTITPDATVADTSLANTSQPAVADSSLAD
ncbi:unnamed protein product [Heligmosomoides polygyrus]|uniref:DUF5641 domain-containing protein n=1 Tax=Heligmosomoides polygyrus TaxID=6339 RepID=A0A183FMT1_HELPZ|nr:unnamed protein product [Heligmosomoides polygyrus]